MVLVAHLIQFKTRFSDSYYFDIKNDSLLPISEIVEVLQENLKGFNMYLFCMIFMLITVIQ